MRKYGYTRPSATLYVNRRRQVRSKKPSFFFKIFVYLLVILITGFCGYEGYQLFKSAQFANWRVKTVSVSGVTGPREQEIFALAAPLTDKPFTFAQAQSLQSRLQSKYPMLQTVRVSRGFFNGKLKITVKPREEMLQIVLPDGTRKYMDKNDVIYDDPSLQSNVPQIELVGDLPPQWQTVFVQTIKSVLKLKKTLVFSSLRFDLQQNAARMQLPDGSTIRFGEPKQLKEKILRAMQILDKSRSKYPGPVTLDFTFFNQGKVFLTLSSH